MQKISAIKAGADLLRLSHALFFYKKLMIKCYINKLLHERDFYSKSVGILKVKKRSMKMRKNLFIILLAFGIFGFFSAQPTNADQKACLNDCTIKRENCLKEHIMENLTPCLEDFKSCSQKCG